MKKANIKYMFLKYMFHTMVEKNPCGGPGWLLETDSRGENWVL